VKRNGDTIVVDKNRRRAFWALTLVGFMILVSLVLLVTGLVSKSGVLWTVVWLGLVGLLGFGGSAGLIVHTMRSPWHLAVSPTHLKLHTPTYLLDVPWDNVAGIAVDEVNWREGCTLVFENPAAVAESARFLARSSRPDIVTDAATMLARMKDCYANLGYHLGIPGRILEKGPAELADLLSRACSGQLWQEGEEPQ
jgi:hypothetical protein